MAAFCSGWKRADDAKDLFLPGRLAQQLPDGVYRFANEPHDARLAALAFALGAYRFTRYRKAEARKVKLDLPQSVDRDELERIVEAVTLARDLDQYAGERYGTGRARGRRACAGRAPRRRRQRHRRRRSVDREFSAHPRRRPRRADRAPRLIDMTWGDAEHPRVTLVGKGVCFDTGGLDIKPDASMLNMKKDMGGAATALALAHMIMARKLESAVARAHPGGGEFDLRRRLSARATSIRRARASRSRSAIPMPKAASSSPMRWRWPTRTSRTLIADFATLTGAARVALGPDVPPFFTDDDDLADELMSHAASRERSAVAAAAVAAL